MCPPTSLALMSLLAFVGLASCRPAAPPEPQAGAARLRVRGECPGPETAPWRVLETAEGPLTLRNGSSRDSLESWPCVEREGRAFALDERETPDETSVLGWRHAEVLDGRTVVGVLDTRVEGPGPALHLVVTTDAGRTWVSRSVVTKPHYMAEFFDLTRVGASGDDLRLTLRLADCADCGVASGYYEAESGDGGQTWTAWRGPSWLEAPAGLGFQPSSLEPSRPLCQVLDVACAPVEAVVVAGVFTDTGAARAALAEARQSVGLAPGYPFVAHTDELGAADSRRGVAVVLASFALARHATQWAAHVGGDALVLPVRARSQTAAEHVVELTASGDVPAFVLADLWDQAGREDTGYGVPETVLARAPRCRISAGSLFVVTHAALRDGFFEWVPVRCPDDAPAFVQRKHTALDTTQGRQLLGFACDVPVVRELASGRISTCED